MKKFYLLFLLAAGVTTLQAQTLFTYGNNKVSADEFLRAYNKNKVPVADKEKALREYLDLYTSFKLKVQAASELKLDTLEMIKVDIGNFRNQVEENYMSDEKGREALFAEAVDRSYKDLHLLHFSVPVATEAPADTMNAYLAIKTAYEALQKGNKDYKGLTNNNPVKFNDIGFVTVFSLPYTYENIIYGLKPGEVSRPYRSKNAWHVFKLMEVRPSAGKWRVAQILFSLSPSATEHDKEQLRKRADSIYDLLANGAEFGVLAKKVSEDKLTYMTGGELPEFSTGKYDPAFEKEVVKLKKDGEISKPFATSFGYHIIKRLAHIPMPKDKNDPAFLFDIRQKVTKDARIEAPKVAFSKQIFTKTGFKRSGNVNDADLMRYADSIMLRPAVDNIYEYPISNKQIIKFNNGSLNASDWLKFVVEYKNNYDKYKGESNKELWEKYTVYAAGEYYKDHLEDYNEDFRYQMKEFKEGNMLFEVMERNVWGLANNDTAGLKKHYNNNRSKYTWPVSADVLIFNCTNEKSAEDAMYALKYGKYWRSVADVNNASVQADSGRYELAQLVISPDGKVPVAGSYSPIVKNNDGTATFVKYLHIYPAGGQRSFDEAKGLVINDYQGVLEEKWLASLKKKYPVKVNEAVFKSLLSK